MQAERVACVSLSQSHQKWDEQLRRHSTWNKLLDLVEYASLYTSLQTSPSISIDHRRLNQHSQLLLIYLF